MCWTPVTPGHTLHMQAQAAPTQQPRGPAVYPHLFHPVRPRSSSRAGHTAAQGAASPQPPGKESSPGLLLGTRTQTVTSVGRRDEKGGKR